jgi:hypothetical protein
VSNNIGSPGGAGTNGVLKDELEETWLDKEWFGMPVSTVKTIGLASLNLILCFVKFHSYL